jgi:hypothetical protein
LIIFHSQVKRRWRKWSKKKKGEEEKFVDGKKLMMTSVQQIPLNDRSSMVQ